ncbi:MAG: hypothetical protein EHM72_13655 [Calditrichaeota bacterium]|nr:MAG: hypothetical protein EHM72_13655 [Calditrichota bacterium]
MKKLLMLLIMLYAAAVNGQSSFERITWLQQSGVYFSSDRVTMGGIGIGGGVQFVYRDHWTAQTDAYILWGNGNALVTRLSCGYQRDGRWQPAILAALNLLGGQRTEILSADGQRPPIPQWAVGLAAAPLRFHSSFGSVSALEFGYGLSPDHGRCLHFTILSMGIVW